MGANNSKSESSNEDELRFQLSKMFRATNFKDIGLLDRIKLEKAWNSILCIELTSLFSSYVECEVASRKKTDDKKILFSLYTMLVKGNNSDIVQLLNKLFKTKSSSSIYDDSFNIDHLKTYFSYLFSSLLISLEAENNNILKLWRKHEAGLSEEIRTTIIDFLIMDMKCENSLVSTDELEKWLIRCPHFLSLQSDILRRAFCYHESLGTIQKHLPLPDFAGINKTKLDLYHVMFLSNYLLPEYRIKWRLLYSSQHSGESWVIFLKNIIDQGPTFLFIWDKSKRCFGGFASSSWSLSPHFYGDDNCFLFTLLPTIAKFEPTNFNKNFQYVNTAQATFPNGLGMGGQLDYWGLYIDSSMKFGKVSASCSTFANYKRFTDETFDIEDIEVWGVDEKPIPLEPEGRQRSVLDSQTEAKAVLEMLGKRQVSEGLRESEPIGEE